MKKLFNLFAICGVLALGYLFLYGDDKFEVVLDESNKADISSISEVDVEGEGEYEYLDEEKASDCTKYEKYDEVEKYCYFECDTDEECALIEKKIENELDKLGEAYDTFSKDFQEFNGDLDVLEAKSDVVYSVSSGEKYEVASGSESKSRNKIKNWLKDILPSDFSDEYIARLVIYVDSEDDVAASVEKSDIAGKWDIFVNEASLVDGEKEMLFTLIHEVAHIVTLNSSQVDPDIMESVSCKQFYLDEGCPKNYSYFNSFYRTFWEGKYEVMDGYDTADQESLIAGKKVEDFVTEYAMSHPVEDIAESFAAFILNNDIGKVGTVASEKVNFFSSFSELIELRYSMRQALKTYLNENLS
ncbi:hypothetical protein ISS03_01625 [Patescibacteria group bacterium]|nr:hypothetical protein [Patescibacteria group bacterium]